MRWRLFAAFQTALVLVVIAGVLLALVPQL